MTELIRDEEVRRRVRLAEEFLDPRRQHNLSLTLHSLTLL